MGLQATAAALSRAKTKNSLGSKNLHQFYSSECTFDAMPPRESERLQYKKPVLNITLAPEEIEVRTPNGLFDAGPLSYGHLYLLLEIPDSSKRHWSHILVQSGRAGQHTPF